MIKKKHRIAVIGLKGLPAFGGAAAVGENIIEQLKHQYYFTVYSTASHTDLKTGEYSGYRQIVFRKIMPGKLNSLYYYFASMIHCIFQDYDLIHTHHNVSGMIIPLLKLKFKVINTLHSVDKIRENFKNISIFIKLFQYITIRSSDAVTCVAKPAYINYYNKKVRNIYYIPNGISTNVEILKDDREMAKPYIMFAAGRILPSKGCHLVLNAIRYLKMNKKLIVAGNAITFNTYQQQLKELSKDLNVDFIGLIKDRARLNGYIKNSDYFVFPSSLEAMSMMLLEVSALKTPIICSDIPENKAIFNSNEVLFFQSMNYYDLAEKIEWAETHPELMQEKASKAFKKAQTKYLWKNLVLKYDELFKKIIGNQL